MSIWFRDIPDEKKFPMLESSIETEVAVIGGGILGILTAWILHQRGHSVVLIEKNHIATGDSGATTGFLTRVPDVSLAELEKKYGIEFIKRVFEATRGAQLNFFSLIKKLESENMECDFSECDSYYGLYGESDNVFETEWEILRKANIKNVSRSQNNESSQQFHDAVSFHNEGKFHPRKFLLGLASKLNTEKTALYEASEVLSIQMTSQPTIQTNQGTVKAKKIVIATGRPISLFNELQSLVSPKLTYVATAEYKTPPLTSNLFWDTLDPYFYYRMVSEKTLMVGGADRKLPSGEPEKELEKFLSARFSGDFKISEHWSGSLFETEDGLPYAFSHPHLQNQVFVGTGFGGNGLIFGMLTASVLADLVGGIENQHTELLSLNRTGKKIERVERKIGAEKKEKMWVKLGPLSDFPEGKPFCKIIQGNKLAVFRFGNSLHVLDNTCSHAGGSLCEGFLNNKIIQCPLHGAKFDLTTGEVKGPPAVRPQKTYATRVSGQEAEVEIEGSMAQSFSKPMVTVEKKEPHWRALILYSFAALLFWLGQFSIQWFWLSEKEIGASFVRSFGLAGATLISFALASSSVFKWVPAWAVYWRLRRYFGVSGFVFAVFHVWTVYHFYFNYDVAAAYWSFNPLKNPIIFSSIAFPILMIMAATSTDWAVEKLTPRIWKIIHRFVYIAYWGIVFHFLLINPVLIKNPPGYFLLSLIALTLTGELVWFIKTIWERRLKTWGVLIGTLVILLYVITAYLAYQKYFTG